MSEANGRFVSWVTFSWAFGTATVLFLGVIGATYMKATVAETLSQNNRLEFTGFSSRISTQYEQLIKSQEETKQLIKDGLISHIRASVPK